MIKILDLFNEEIYQQIVPIWLTTGVGNPVRGDNYQVITNTLLFKGKFITAWDNEKVIGTCWLSSDNRRLYLHHMAVLPEYQNQRIGQAMLNYALEYGKSLGLQIKLEVNEHNPSAIHLYEKYGFKFIEGYVPMIKRTFQE